MDRLDFVWEISALVIVVSTILGFTIGVYSYRSYEIVKRLNYNETIVIEARIYEAGGWFPSKIIVETGKPIELKIYSVDMVHSLMIPKLNIDTGPIIPSHWKTVTLVIEKPGIYEFYCEVTCSPMHGLMQGVIIAVSREKTGT